MPSFISALVIAVVTGFNTGLLRSAMTILAYLVAMPIAVGRCRMVSPQLDGQLRSPFAQNSLLFFGIFLVAGMVLGKLARHGPRRHHRIEAGIGDRLGGAALGAVRVGLVAITLVLIFDQLVPADRQPAFLTGSRLRPSAVGGRAKGFQVAAAGSRRHDRPPEERPADIIGDRPDDPDMHFGGEQPLITAARLGYSGAHPTSKIT